MAKEPARFLRMTPKSKAHLLCWPVAGLAIWGLAGLEALVMKIASDETGSQHLGYLFGFAVFLGGLPVIAIVVGLAWRHLANAREPN
jgi:hypothetical protein